MARPVPRDARARFPDPRRALAPPLLTRHEASVRAYDESAPRRLPPFNNLLPARAGDAVRVFYLHNEAGTSRSESVGTVVTERIYDVLSLLLLLFVAAPFLPEVTWLTRAVFLAAVLTAFVLVLAFVLWRSGERPVRRRILRPLAHLPGVSADDTERAAERLTLGLAGLHRPRVALVARSPSRRFRGSS